MPLSTINSNSIKDGTVIAADILDGTISSSKLVSANIAGDRLAANTLSNTVFQTGSVENYLNASGLGFGMRNRIINGAMVIDQRNAGASVTPTTDNTYTLDRWTAKLSQSSKYSVQQSSTVPAGFKNALLATSLSAYTVGSGEIFCLKQIIEGLNIADLGWGTSDAQSVTLSFKVRSSLTGTFGGALWNSDGSRSYPFSYTISAANTYETKTITIAGDTSGTWLTTNGAGINVGFSLGSGSTYSGTAGAWSGSFYTSSTGATSVVGTNGATFYITGVQLEKGSTATSFEYRQYGTELALCQRYYEKSFAQGTAPAYNQAFNFSTGTLYVGTSISIPIVPFKVTKRASPTMVMYGVSTSGWRYYAAGFTNLSSFTGAANDAYFYAEGSGTSGLSLYQSTIIGGNWTAEAEL